MSIRYKIEILKPQLNDYVYAGLVHVNPENGEKTHVYSKVLETSVNGNMVVEGPEKKPWIVNMQQIEPITITEEILRKIGFKKYNGIYTFYYRRTMIGTIFLFRCFSCYRMEISGNEIPTKFEYVHQLQQLLRFYDTDIEIEL